MSRRIFLAVLTVVLSLVLTAAVGATPKKDDSTATATGTSQTSTNNGGNNPNCGNSCDQSHNPGDYEKPCSPVPGNGCHTLPDTPCERGHGGTEKGNKHCGTQPDLTILKEDSTSRLTGFVHDGLDVALGSNVFYRITVTNNTGTAYDLAATDVRCDDAVAHAISPSSGTVAANSTFVFTCDIDAIPGAGDIPIGAVAGGAPDTLTNSVSVVATPVGGGASVTLTDSVSASVN